MAHGKTTGRSLLLLFLVSTFMILMLSKQSSPFRAASRSVEDLQHWFDIDTLYNKPQEQFTTRENKGQDQFTIREKNGQYCFPWTVNGSQVDEWWTHHPQWDIASEDDQGTCFAKVSEPERASFLQRIYDIQWGNASNCSNAVQTVQVSSGYGASLSYIKNFFKPAITLGRTYQVTKHWEGMKWLYSARDNTSWAWCPSVDINCYILPLSKCKAEIGRNDVKVLPRVPPNVTTTLWVHWYMTRFQHHVRKHVQNLVTNEFPPLQLPCTAMHVRRGDSGLSRRPFRRYAALWEYIEAANISAGDNVVLLTDDRSTIEEAQRFHPQINWLFANRSRHRHARAGFEHHIPSRDPAFDFAMILAELRFAKHCSSLVSGTSGFAGEIEREILRAGTQLTIHQVDTSVSMEEAKKVKGKQRAENMIADILKSNLERSMGNTTTNKAMT